MALLDNDRLSHWYGVMHFSWTVCFSLLAVPIVHVWLGFSIGSVAVVVGTFGGVQLAILPWLYSARSPPQNPDGLVGRRTAAVFVWLSVTTLLLLCYIQRGLPRNPTSQHASIIFFGSLVVTLIALGLLLRLNFRFVTQWPDFFAARASSQPSLKNIPTTLLYHAVLEGKNHSHPGPQFMQCPCMTASALSTLFFNRFSGKERKGSLWCGERSQGRRFLAFISTLDTGLDTFTIDPGTKSRVLF